MLLYRPPFLVVGRLTLFPDHLDPDAFYYLVSVPDLARDDDRPAFWASAILDEVSVTGPAGGDDLARVQLSFDVQLAPTAAELTAAEDELKARRGRERVRLSPAPLSGGKVSLVVARPTTSPDDRAVFVHTGHPPALLGDNRAAFAVAATGPECRLLAAAIERGALAAVVAYELEMLGLVPAFQATMKVHWQLVYSHVSERSIANYLIYSDQLDETVDELTRTQAVEVQITELDPEVEAEAAKALLDQLKAELVDKLFEPALTAGDTPVEERIGRGVREVLSSILPGYHHALRTLDQEALATTVIDLREQAARVYKHHPQSTLAGLLARAGDVGPLVRIRLDEVPDRIEEWRVAVAPGLAELGLAEVLVWVEARGADDALVADAAYQFAAGTATQPFRFRRQGRAEARLRWRAELVPLPGFAPDVADRWATDWHPAEGGRVHVDPRSWVAVTRLRVEVDDAAMFALPASVEVQLEARLRDAPAPFRVVDLTLTPERPAETFTVIAPRGHEVVLRAVEVLRRPNEPELRRETGELRGPVHRVRNPFATAWRMEIHAAARWTETAALVAELRVWEPTRKLWLQAEHRFTAQAPSYVLAFATSAETPQAAEVRLTRLTVDASVVRGPWLDLVGKIARVTDAVLARRRVRVRLRAPGFVTDRIRKVTVELSYQPATGDALAAVLAFRKDGEAQDWLHDLPDPSRAGYRWRASAVSEDGERWSRPWTDADSDDLDVELPVQPFSG